MRMKMRRVLALLSFISLCIAQKKRSQEVWEQRDKTNTKSCSNLTQVLDNWKYAIMYHVKDLLVNDHASVLPEYVRIKSLSEAVSDLYNQFNTLKDNLGKLTSRFESVENFVDELQASKQPKPWLWRPPQRLTGGAPTQIQLRSSARAANTGQWAQRARARRGPGTGRH